MRTTDHPNEPGQWTLEKREGSLSLWRRDRHDPAPVTMFYVVRPGCQNEIIYQREQALARFSSLTFACATGDIDRRLKD